jgi:DNA-binding response OmpR family regulator
VARVVAFVSDLFFASKIKETLTTAGHEVEIASTFDRTIEAADAAELVIVDLHVEGLDPAQLSMRLGGKPLIGFYSHVDADARAQATRAGFKLVVPRSRMAREMPNLVERLLSG